LINLLILSPQDFPYHSIGKARSAKLIYSGAVYWAIIKVIFQSPFFLRGAYLPFAVSLLPFAFFHLRI
jgi:hypothetical protein